MRRSRSLRCVESFRSETLEPPRRFVMPDEPLADLERSKRLTSELGRILNTLDDRLHRAPSDVVADSSMLHFSLAFEIAWKLCQSIAVLAELPTHLVTLRALHAEALRRVGSSAH